MQNLSEAVSLENTLNAINGIILTIPDMYQNMISAMNSYDFDSENPNEESKLNFMLNTYTSRWMSKNYLGKGNLKDQLELLVKFLPNRTVDIRKFIRSLSTNASNKIANTETYSNISGSLPDLFLASEIEKLKHIGKIWKTNIQNFSQAKSKYLRQFYNDISAEKPVKQKSDIPGQQNTQVELIVNDVLKRISKKDAGEIRNIIARAPNKLLALQQELQKRNIHVGESISLLITNIIQEERILELVKKITS